MKHHINAIKEKVSEHRKELFIVFIIFLLAFGVRAFLMKYELAFEFDSYWHARMLSYMVQTGNVPNIDPLAYWNFPGGMSVDRTSMLFWQISAFFYGIFALGSAAYSKEAIVLVMKIMPALFGALAAVGSYFLVKEIYGKKVAFAAAFFVAVMPAFVYRTMAGFYEPTSIGFMWIVFGLYFLARAANNSESLRQQVICGLMSGIMLGLLALSWKGFLFAIPIFIASCFFVALNILSKKGTRQLVNFLAYFAIAVVAFASLGWISMGTAMIDIPVDIISTFSRNLFGEGFAAALAGIAIVALAFVGFMAYAFRSREGTAKAFVSYAKTIALVVMILVMLYAVTSGKDFSSSGVIGSSIGEESHGNLYFGNKYNLMFLFFAAAIIIIPLKDFFDKEDMGSPIILTLAAVTFFLAWTKLKFTFLFGLPLALTSAPLFWLVLESKIKMSRTAKMAGTVVLGFLLLAGIAAGSFFVTQQMPNIEMDTGWKEGLKWVSVNLPKDAKILNWWDEGHWISFIGERGPIIDNRNADGESRQKVSLLLSTSDLNEAEGIVSKTRPDYFLLGDDLLMKQMSLAQYAYNSFNDPRIKQTFGLSFACSKSVQEVSGTVSYNCGGNSLSDAQMSSLPSAWVDQPNNFLNERTPVFIYRKPDSSKIYVLNAEANDTFLARLWFHEPSVYSGKFEEVYSFKEVKVFKVLG